MSAERNLCPDEFQSELTRIGGINRYDQPCFKLVWAQYETYRAGGVWTVDEAYYRGYRDLLACSGEPCWALMQWHSPEEYGSPEAYYAENYDESTGLQYLGEYPYGGRYEVLYNLRWHEMVDGKLEFFTLPLNTRIFDIVGQIVAIAKEVSIERTKAAYDDARKREEADKLHEVEKSLRANALPFTDTVSYTRQGIRSTVIDKKMLQMREKWAELSRNARSFHKGLQTR